MKHMENTPVKLVSLFLALNMFTGCASHRGPSNVPNPFTIFHGAVSQGKQGLTNAARSVFGAREITPGANIIDCGTSEVTVYTPKNDSRTEGYFYSRLGNHHIRVGNRDPEDVCDEQKKKHPNHVLGGWNDFIMPRR